MKFELVTVNVTNFDGRVVQSGATVGFIESELPIDNVVSSLRSLQLAVVPHRPEEAAKPEPPKTATQPAPSTATNPEPENSPLDSLGPVESLSDSEPLPDDVDPLAGLTAKVAESLIAALISGEPAPVGSLDTPDKIQAAIDSGFDLADLDGIGPRAVVKIKEWLAALKG